MRGTTIALALALALAPAALVASAALGQEITVVAKTGDITPGGTIWQHLGPAASITPGTVFFSATLAPDYEEAVLQSHQGSLSVLFRQGTALNDAGIRILDFRNFHPFPKITENGDLVVSAGWEPLEDSGDAHGIFHLPAGASSPTIVVIDGTDMPNETGQMFIQSGHPPLSSADAEWIAFHADVSSNSGSGIFAKHKDGPLQQIARTGQPPPHNASPFLLLSLPSINGNGDLAFTAQLEDDSSGVFRYSVDEEEVLAIDGPLLSRGSQISELGTSFGVPINEAGQVGIRARIEDPNDDVEAILIWDETELLTLAHGGQSPDSGQPGVLPLEFDRHIALNNAGQVAFMSSQFLPDTGVFRAGPGGLIAIAREGGAVPETQGGVFTLVSGQTFALNDLGDVAFVARYEVNGEPLRGLFLFTDEDGLSGPLVRNGQIIEGRAIASFSFLGTHPNEFRANEPSGLDSQGGLAFQFSWETYEGGIGTIRSPRIFANGFESGDTAQWQ